MRQTDKRETKKRVMQKTVNGVIEKDGRGKRGTKKRGNE